MTFTPFCPWCKVPCNTDVKDVQKKEKELKDKRASHKPASPSPGAADHEQHVGEVMACPAEAVTPAGGKNSKVLKPRMKPKKSQIKNNVDESVRGQLQPLAASMLMRLLYGARYARFDLGEQCCLLGP